MADPVLSALAAGKAKLRRGWTKGALARDARGRESLAAEAVAWCVEGAICTVLHSEEPPDAAQREAHRYLSRVTRSLGHGYPHVFNDNPRTELRHALGLYDFASELRRLDLRGGR